MAKIKLIDLYECVQSALVASGAGKYTVRGYRCSGFRPLQRYFEQKGRVYYSRKLADEFVSEYLNAYQNNRIHEKRFQRVRKVAEMLEEYKNTGAIKWAYLPGINAISFTCKHFETVLSQYLLGMSSKYSPKTIAGFRSVIKPFLLHLESQGHRKISCLTRKIVSTYIPVIAERQPGNMSNVIHGLKTFLEYLHENKYIASELVSALPSHPKKRRKHIAGFTREETKALICSVSSDTKCGKRDVAMFTLAESVGLRAVDVVNLKLSDIDWRNKTISIIQHKTRRPLILPLENHAGDALAEYILHGRPDFDSPFIFLTARRPFRQLSAESVSAATGRYIKKSGIENNPSMRKGFHCFRRGVGTWLLEAELPLAMISEILGHSHIDSAKPYLSTDHEGLRACALGLDGIEIRSGVFR